MKRTDFSNINSLWATLLIEELWRLGVRHCCIAPGSRSAPLTFAAVTHSHMQTHVHFDERGVGFFALGLAKASQQAAMVITTSGSAVANLFPALIEARQSEVPLILVTADRPPELIGCGANQAIQQSKIFADYPEVSVELPTPSDSIPLRWLLSTIDEAFARSCAKNLPLHINCMLRDPLYPHQPDHTMGKSIDDINAWWQQQTPYTQYERASSTQALNEAAWHAFVMSKGNRSAKGLIVVGRLSSVIETTTIVQLSQQLSWPLLVDVHSQLQGHPNALLLPDLFVASESGQALLAQCDRVLQIGGYLTSKRLDQWLGSRAWQHYWMIDEAERRIDPHYRQTNRLIGDINSILQQCLNGVPSLQENVTWYEQYNAVASKCVNQLATLGDETLSERWLGRHLASLLPNEASLFLGNSLPIRTVAMFAQQPLTSVYTSRGASGIDGLIATSAGCAVATQRPMVLAIGDLSFFYDLNSLKLLSSITTPFVIVLTNNDGGGIFYATTRGCREEDKLVVADYFVAPHGFNAKHAAALFGLQYAQPQSIAAFTEHFAAAMAHQGATIIEVITPSGAGLADMEQAYRSVAAL